MARHADGGLVLCFGGADGRDLFITTPDNTDDPPAGGVFLRTRVGVAGAPIPAAAARTPDE
jgi:sugar lactone lactonase YvrE